MVVNSLGGGTGSGMGSLLASRLSVDYPKKYKTGIKVFQSPSISNTVV